LKIENNKFVYLDFSKLLIVIPGILCGKSGKWAISVPGDVCGTSRSRRVPYLAQDWNCFPTWATHTIFCHASAFVDQCNRAYTQHFWGFPVYHPALLGISIILPGTFWDSILPPGGRKKVAFQCFNHYRKLNFQYRRDKKAFFF